MFIAYDIASIFFQFQGWGKQKTLLQSHYAPYFNDGANGSQRPPNSMARDIENQSFVTLSRVRIKSDVSHVDGEKQNFLTLPRVRLQSSVSCNRRGTLSCAILQGLKLKTPSCQLCTQFRNGVSNSCALRDRTQEYGCGGHMTYVTGY